jgi:hypothetical protein
MTRAPERLLALLSELESGKPRVVQVKRRADTDAWSMRSRDGTTWLAQWRAEPARLLLSSVLGKPADASQQMLLEAALSYNALMRENGAIRLAMRETSSELILMRDLYVDGLTLSQLGPALSDFASSVRMWSVFVANQSVAANDAAEPADALQQLA